MLNKNKKKLNLEIPNVNSNTLISGSGGGHSPNYPKQIEYLKLLSKNQLVTLKQLCFITFSKIFYDQLAISSSHINKSPSTSSPKMTSTTPTLSPTTSSSSIPTLSNGIESLNISGGVPFVHSSNNNNNNNNNSFINGIHLLPLELKEELLHFMLEHRLLHIGKLHNSLDFLSVVDSRIKSLDFSIVKSKITFNDPSRELLKICTNLQNIDLSYCYEANDSLLKILIQNLSNQPNSNPSTPTSLPTSSTYTLLQSIEDHSDHFNHHQHHHSSSSSTASSLRKSFLNKILKKRRPLINQQQQNIDQSPVNSPPQTPLSQSNSTSSFEDNSTSGDNESISSSTTSDSLHSSASDMSSSSSLNGANSNSNFNSSGLLFLSLKQCTSFSDGMIRRLLKISTNLTYLDLTGCSIHSKTIQLVTSNCLKLKTLSLSTIPLPLTPSIVNSFHNILNLTSLDLSFVCQLTDQVMISLLSQPTSISSSSIINNNNNNIQNSFNNKSSSPLTSPRKSNCIQSLSSISSSYSSNNLKTFLDLSSSNLFSNSTGSGGGGVNSLISGVTSTSTIIFPTSLLSLNLAQSEIEDESLLLISKKCPFLQDIDISFCSKISNQGISDLVSQITTLQSFSARIVKVSNGIVDVIQRNRFLTKLDIRFTKIEESHILEISNHLSMLRILRLDGTPITDGILESITKKNQSLEILGLSQCKNITFEIFNILQQNSRSLVKLFLSHSRLGLSTNQSSNSSTLNISNTNILQYLEKFFNIVSLNTLDIAFTPLVNDQVLVMLAQSLKTSNSISTLFIGGGFHNLSNYVIFQLSSNCPRMRVFSCISSFNLLDDSICECLRKWLLLEAIELTDCTSLTSITPNLLINDETSTSNHVHFHLRFIFFSNSLEFKDHSILSKIEGKTSIEIFEMRQKITLEDIIEQNWLTI